MCKGDPKKITQLWLQHPGRGNSKAKITTSSRGDRRLSPRMKPRSVVHVKCRSVALGLGPNVSVQVLDISEAGLGLIVNAELQRKDEVEILIFSSGLTSIAGLAEVCWVVPAGGKTWCVGLRLHRTINSRDLQAVSLHP